MGLLELFLIAVSLSMDAFAVSACIGLNIKNKRLNWNQAVISGLYFGAAQFIMPVIGYLAGSSFTDRVSGFSAYIGFAVLAFIGAKMIKESLDKSEKKLGSDLNYKNMLVLAVATSIDALAVGIVFAVENVSIIPAAGFIGVVTFILAIVGVKIGGILGSKLKNKAEFAGGFILILIGAKILLEHLEII